MPPVYCPGNPYPTVWERLLEMMSPRKNRAKAKAQKERARTKGGRKPGKPPHRGGGWFSGGGGDDWFGDSNRKGNNGRGKGAGFW